MWRRLRTLAPALQRAAAAAAAPAASSSVVARAAPISSAARAFHRTSPLLSGDKPVKGGGRHAHRHGARARGARSRASGEEAVRHGSSRWPLWYQGEGYPYCFFFLIVKSRLHVRAMFIRLLLLLLVLS
ncbi:hypothetical protein PR202_ga10532 [Eleusine coracana subsp. coracana]|uniref:Uncharacterized protein n=1 Tax=Eleusine coracana subsp. coracana TaxID=191504 RepID=A0AAV5C6Y8_ELECO|nr:hypothetical protein PR202_ga10532 [Eleusine coracana subsp. coracana]